jgi:hypothetical protein
MVMVMGMAATSLSRTSACGFSGHGLLLLSASQITQATALKGAELERVMESLLKHKMILQDGDTCVLARHGGCHVPFAREDLEWRRLCSGPQCERAIHRSLHVIGCDGREGRADWASRQYSSGVVGSCRFKLNMDFKRDKLKFKIALTSSAAEKEQQKEAQATDNEVQEHRGIAVQVKTPTLPPVHAGACCGLCAVRLVYHPSARTPPSCLLFPTGIVCKPPAAVGLGDSA